MTISNQKAQKIKPSIIQKIGFIYFMTERDFFGYPCGPYVKIGLVKGNDDEVGSSLWTNIRHDFEIKGNNERSRFTPFVSFLIKLTLLLLELFCMPIINNKNKQEFKVIEKNNFLNTIDISCIKQYISNIDYKSCFLESHFFWRDI